MKRCNTTRTCENAADVFNADGRAVCPACRQRAMDLHAKYPDHGYLLHAWWLPVRTWLRLKGAWYVTILQREVYRRGKLVIPERWGLKRLPARSR